MRPHSDRPAATDPPAPDRSASSAPRDRTAAPAGLASRDRTASFGRAAVTLLVGAAGGLAFYGLGLPAAFLTGSAIAIALAVVLRVPLALPKPIRTGAFALVGTLAGTAIPPDVFDRLAALPVALAGLILAVVGATAASAATLVAIARWDPLSAICGSIPGNLPMVIEVSEAVGARMEHVVLSQSARLLILVAVVPFVLTESEGAAMRAGTGASAGSIEVLSTLALALAAGFAAARLHIPAGTIIVPLLLSAALSISGTMTVAVPEPLGAAAFVVVGISVAIRFTAVQRAGLGRAIVASLAAFLAAFVVAMAVAAAVSQAAGLPIGAVFLAFAPGGADAMIAMAFLLNFEVALVATLHTTRMLLIAALAPPVMVRLQRRLSRPR